MVAPASPPVWTLAELLRGAAAGDCPPTLVRGLALDSRGVEPGTLFLACRGSAGHGLEHLQAALAAGAAAVAFEPPFTPLPRDCPVPLVPVPGLAARAGAIAARYYGRPGEDLLAIAVTGTNGKTSVTHLVAGMLGGAGSCDAGLIGTLGSGRPGALRQGRLTTPDAVSLQRLLAEFRDAGLGAAVLEASSHALDQHRLDAVPIDVAVFTNLSRDHLDYHGDLERYKQVKSRLFARPGLRAAVVNIDDPAAPAMLAACPAGVRRFGVGFGGGQALEALEAVDELLLAEPPRPGGTGIGFRLHAGGAALECSSRLIGRFNAENLALALGVARALDLPLEQAARALAALPPVPGRLECFGGGPGKPLAVVDYAHTPAALAAALAALRETGRRPLVLVFGCGGDRDRGKRPEMGAVARAADRVILTSDNPRSEAPAGIIEAIAEGLAGHEAVQVIPERAEAIRRSLAEAPAEAVVLVAGKGHEDYQEIAGRRLPFSDRALVASLAGRRR